MHFNGRDYDLSGMVDFQGAHFVATVKDRTDGNWYKYDDSTVSQVPRTAVISNHSYMAFFVAA
jgi:ubiquitin C-terminal hydrolase